MPRVSRPFNDGRRANLEASDHCLATTKYLSEELTVSSRPDLASAGRVVSGGRALKSQENFTNVLDPLADALNAGWSFI